MSALRRLLTTLFVVAMLAMGAAQAASTTNFSDQWWVASESGWGASVHQQSDVLFIDLLVYGPDGKPTWFFVAAFLQPTPPGHPVFSGELFATTGPYYAAGFDPAAVSSRKVGTLTFDADTATSAIITYTVDGTLVVKRVTRQTWRYEDFDGTYHGGWNADRSGCITGHANETHFEDALAITVARMGDTLVNVTLTFADGGSESFSGLYTQSGHLGRIDGVFPHSFGNITVTEIEVTSAGFSARFAGDLVSSRWQDWCDMKNGRIGGVRR